MSDRRGAGSPCCWPSPDRVGLPARAAEKVLDEALSSTENLADELEPGALPFSPQVLRNVVRPLRNRRKSAAPRA